MEEKQKVFKITAPICLGVSVVYLLEPMAGGAQQDTGASGPTLSRLSGTQVKPLTQPDFQCSL